MNKTIALIPARLGSQRLKRKNLREIEGKPIIQHAIEKCISAGIFDDVFVNSESEIFKPIAEHAGAKFHLRPKHLGDDKSTSEQYITEFLQKHNCERLVQVHSIAPLLSTKDIKDFVSHFISSDLDVLLSVTREQIECLYDSKPLNFTFEEKTNSQELKPVERITWSITGWKSSTFLEAVKQGKCATYSGKVDTFPLPREAGHIIKTEDDLRIAQALWSARNS